MYVDDDESKIDKYSPKSDWGSMETRSNQDRNDD